MLKRIFLLLPILVVLSACNHGLVDKTKTKATTHTIKKETVSTDQKDKNSQTKKLEKAFMPPKFVVTSFESMLDKDNKSLNFKLDYKLNTDLYKILKNRDYFFSIEMPPEVEKYTQVAVTHFKKGPNVKDGRLTYSITINQPLPTNISKVNINALEKQLSKPYNLGISYNGKDVFQIYNDIKSATKFNAETSNSYTVEDGQETKDK